MTIQRNKKLLNNNNMKNNIMPVRRMLGEESNNFISNIGIY